MKKYLPVRKVWAALVVAFTAFAGVFAVKLGEVDWSGFGPYGPLIGAAVAATAAWAAKGPTMLPWTWIVRRVKAMLTVVAGAALAAVLEQVDAIDWASMGPWGPAIGAAAAAVLGYIVRPAPTDEGVV